MQTKVGAGKMAGSYLIDCLQKHQLSHSQCQNHLRNSLILSKISAYLIYSMKLEEQILVIFHLQVLAFAF